MAHFTYSENIDRDSLGQGDVLIRTKELDEVIEKVHPYFFEKKDQYHYFQVITQSCDLVRRHGKCNAQHITIAAVRDLESVLKREFDSYGESQFENKFGFFDEKHRQKFQDFLMKLLNNNITKYFYLHQEPVKNFDKDLVTTLRVNIALKTELHYDTLMKAKAIELSSEFKAKLGWLVGNLYSRVGTQDWVPENITSNDFKEKINEIIDYNFVFVPSPKKYEQLYSKNHPEEHLNNISLDEFLSFVEQNKLPKKREVLMNELKKILLAEKIPEKQSIKIVTKLVSDIEVSKILK